MSNDPASNACGSGCAAKATKKNASSNSPTAIATRSTRRYDPVSTTANSATAAIGSVATRGRPYSSPTPATPENSVSSAPTVAIPSPVADTQPQTGPNVSRINSPWPRPVTTPSRTVSSCTM